jgi:hypothetical protein
VLSDWELGTGNWLLVTPPISDRPSSCRTPPGAAVSATAR